MICKVKKTIDKYSLLNNVKSVAVGVSGGADSMCLLDILRKLKDEYGIILNVVHLNHNIRGEEAERDEEFVKNFCEKNNLEFFLFSEDIPALSEKYGLSEEECGRKVRYECFEKVNCDAVAVAHSLSDSVETVLFNLSRGSGCKGLSGIPVKREPNIIRPLIECSREEIEVYCEKNKVPYITDSTNLSDDYSRNYIRHNIVSNFKRLNPNFEKAVIRASKSIEEEHSFIVDSADKLLIEAEADGGYKRDIFLKAHPAVRKEAFSVLLKEKMKKDLQNKHVELVEEAFILKKSKIEIRKGLYIDLSSDIISFCSAKNKIEPWSSELKNERFYTPFGTYILKEAKKGDENAFDADKIEFELTLSSRKEGDKFYNKKRKNTKSLKKLFNELKISTEVRNAISVLRDGEKVVWIESIGTDGNYLPSETSKRIMKLNKLEEGES